MTLLNNVEEPQTVGGFRGASASPGSDDTTLMTPTTELFSATDQ